MTVVINWRRRLLNEKNVTLNLGLFSNAIAMGGNALCDIFFQTNPQEAAVELASRLDCTSEKGEDILRCLSTQTQQEIVLKQSAMFVSLINFFYLAISHI